MNGLSSGALKSVSLLWIGTITGAGCAFASQIVLARELGPLLFGEFSAAFSFVTMLVPLAGFGIAQFWLKVFGEEGWEAIRWMRPTLRSLIVTTVCAMLIVLVWALFGPHGSTASFLLAALSIYIVGQVSIELVSAKFQLEERYAELSIWQMLPHLARLIGTIALAYFFSTWMSARAVSILYGLIGCALGLVCFTQLKSMGAGNFRLSGHSEVRSENKLPSPSARSAIGYAWPFCLAGMLQLVYFQSDIVLLKYMIGADVAGLYNVAFVIMAALYLIPAAVYQKFLLPKMHRWAHHDRKKLYRVFRQGNVIMMVSGLISVVGIFLLSDEFVTYFFGSSYAKSIGVLNILVLGAPFVFVSFNIGAVLMTKDHMRRKVLYMAVAAAVNLVLNLILIRPYGASGAAWATVITNILLLMHYYYGARNRVFRAELKTSSLISNIQSMSKGKGNLK